MRIITTFVLLSVAISTLAACGNPAPSATEAEPTQPPADTQAAPTRAPTQPPADTQAAPAGEGTRVNVTLADNTIHASQTTFQAGVPYTFVITNSGRHAHNFNINPPASVAGSLEAAATSAILNIGQDDLSVGQTVSVEYTFPASAVGSPLEFSCLIRRHYEDGMDLAITVTQ